jgi:hypothetical protein
VLSAEAGVTTSTGGKPTRGLIAREVRELPAPPRNYWRLVGPGIVAGGVGLSSGEFILWPYIASQVGLVLLWGAFVGVITQFFINMEVERYTLATGETVLTGFNRFWRHWGLVFAVMGYFANLWPGWAISSATLTTYLFAGNATTIAVVTLLVIGFSLTFAPVVYVALERLIFVKVAAVLVLVVLAVAVAIRPESWRALPEGFTHIGTLPPSLGIALVFSAIAFAGSGGAQNLCQSNWIRDKGFGMGQYVPRLVSPVTGAPEATDTMATSYMFEATPANMGRWRSWWQFANIEQAFSFVLVTIITIGLTSLLAHSTLFGQADLPNNCGLRRSSFSGWWRRGSASCSSLWVRSRCSDRRWASSITPAGSPPTFSRPRTSRVRRRAACTSGSCGAWWAWDARSCWRASRSRSRSSSSPPRPAGR